MAKQGRGLDLSSHDLFQMTPERVQKLRSVFQHTKGIPVARSTLNQAAVESAVEASQSRSFLQGASSVRDGHCYLHFQLPSDISSLSENDGELLPYGWSMFFGKSVTFSLAVQKVGFVSRVHVTKADPAYSFLKSGVFTATFSKGKTLVQARAYDYREPALLLEMFLDTFKLAEAPVPERFSDPIAHFWEVSAQLASTFEPHLSRAMKMSHGWVSAFKKTVKSVSAILTHKVRHLPDAAELARLPELLQEYVRLCSGSQGDWAEASRSIRERLATNEHHFFDVYDALQQAEREAREAALNVRLLICLFQIEIDSAERTACGKRLPWLDMRRRVFDAYDIDREAFPPSAPLEQFWTRLPDDWRCNWGHLLEPGDFPIDPGQLAPDINRFPVAEDVDGALASAHALLEEANANKKWCIPPKALVQLSVGPFEFFELTETEKEVLVVARNRDWEFYCFILDVTDNKCSFHLTSDKSQDDENARARISAAVILLLAAVIRDFWVVEERERVFSAANRQGMRGQCSSTSGATTVVYLPRVQYTGMPDLKNCEDALGHKERRAHFVRSHLRQSAHASPHQIQLAELYGFTVPQGYTFVKSHERGKKQKELIYRSRSALQSLYHALELDTHDRPDWFQFERDVHRLMETLGFSVEHVAASARGDNGVDVYATKGLDLEKVCWVIQCKCYRPSRKVGPSVVRELMGTLVTYPRGTRGMIVTTSSFTGPAIEEAKRNDIRAIDGQEFLALSRHQ
jgi:hypothetical protein